MRIIKASAGSGKTYTLSHTYLDYLLRSDDPWAYRHLLAVTFTNKATAEMKERILKDLAATAEGDSPQAEKARHYLVNILHDYGAFGVSTIDRFFQQTLRCFARELGQVNSYQVELDKDSLIEEAVGRVLDNVTENDKELLDWLRLNAMEQLRMNGRFRIDEGLMDMGKGLKSEAYRQLRESSGLDPETAYSKERLTSVHKLCRKIIEDFEKEAAAVGLKPDKDGHYSYPTTKKAISDPQVAELLDRSFAVYDTAVIVDGQLYGLGVAREFEKAFDALLKERNVMPLDESNGLLKKIIDGSDAPFVYEKTGTRYSHYLLDEFQDTSRLQWDNFLPLLKDADAAGGNLVVGDVKQSIYRWRDSDWHLLGEEVQKAFPSATVKNLEGNWRSARTIVEFNRRFFEYAAGELGLTDIYSNVRQDVKSDEPQAGSVRVSFTSDQEAAVLDSVNDAISRGARPGDIAILVRSKADGARIADALREARINFISDDTLDLKSAVSVRRLVSLLSFYDDPSNTVGSFLAASTGIEYPESYHSLVDFCESLVRSLRDYDPETFDAETLYVGAFMDRMQEWTSTNGNDLKAFVRWWREQKDCYIGTPANSDAVRIMTVHKSKGLEFPHVIFPYAHKVQLFKADRHWCVLNGGGTPLGHEADGIYSVNLSGKSVHNLFSGALEEERKLQVIDNMNIFYVALTRASKSLHIIAKEPAAKKVETLKKGKDVEWSNFSELLYAHCGCSEESGEGEPYDFGRMVRKSGSASLQMPAEYASIALGDRLKASRDASDYFGEDGHTGAEASGRLRGIELHAALAQVNSSAELPPGLDPESRALLTERIEAHPEWFADAEQARNELSIFGADGSGNRPDRVVRTQDGGIVVIDYKFGAERDSYIWQVRRYMKLWRDMGYRNVRGYVWYVPEDRIIEV